MRTSLSIAGLAPRRGTSCARRPVARTSTAARRRGGLATVALAAALGAAIALPARAQVPDRRDVTSPLTLPNLTALAILRNGVAPAPLRLGDVYLFSGDERPGTGPSGLRLSSGLFGPKHPFSLFDAPLDGSPSQAYLGLGYTGTWLKSRLSLDADLGLTAPGSGMSHWRGVIDGSQGLDQALRDLHWQPVMALDVRYAF